MAFKKSVGNQRILEILGKDLPILSKRSYEKSFSAQSKAAPGDIFFPSRTIGHNASLLEHILFSLKYEDINLFVLSNGLRHIDKKTMMQSIERSQNSAFLRKAALIWEFVNQGELESNVSSKYINFFDERYVTGEDRKYSKWRINFNGIGDLNWCPVIIKDENLKSENTLFSNIHDFVLSSDKRLLDRAVEWAYLGETEGSFAIERENPSQDKKEAFAQVLKKARLCEKIDEDYLCEIQRDVISNPFNQATSYRSKQNHLRDRGLSATSITYVPPWFELSDEIMSSIEHMANNSQIDPVSLATSISFGFVFAHPFMDGNGRVSRFLIHHTLSKSGQLPSGFMLPVSVAMKRNEIKYLENLELFSRPARKFVEAKWLHDEEYSFEWKESADLFFRYPDLTNQANFMLNMIKESLSIDIQGEIDYLRVHDRLCEKIEERFDIANKDLMTLIKIALDEESGGIGVISKGKRKDYKYKVQEEALDYIQSIATIEGIGLEVRKIKRHGSLGDFSMHNKEKLESYIDALSAEGEAEETLLQVENLLAESFYGDKELD